MFKLVEVAMGPSHLFMRHVVRAANQDTGERI
jgi:hypothetical protein